MSQELSRLARWLTALAGLSVLAACGGGGGGPLAGNPGGGNPPGGNPGGTTVTVSGRITFDRLAFQATLNGGLNAANPVESPAREVVVEALVNGAVTATTTTDANGDYSVSVPANTNVFIRVPARMQKTGSLPTWSFTVRNNANSDALYVLQGETFNSGSTNVTRNLRAASGWGGSSYTGTRAAAPFAILDTVYKAKQLILGAASSAQFPQLNLYWSSENRPTDCFPGESNCSPNDLPFCPDDGNIGTSFYFRDASRTTPDECATPSVLPDGIYILGNFANGLGDTDEFDQHVIAHEFGHYFEDRFSRSDSIGGVHRIGERIDLRVAFGEGWGNAFGAMSLNDPQYRDSSEGISQDFGFNLETGTGTGNVTGWFSEASVGKILWDIFDTTAESGDNVTLGFTPIYDVMIDEEVATPALTSIFSFASALRANNGSQSAAIQNLLQRESITGTDEFGTNETNDGGDVGFTGVYTTITSGSTFTGFCSTNGNAEGNKLGNRRFLRFVKNSSGVVNILANGNPAAGVTGSAAAQDPDIFVYRQGALVRSAETTTSGQESITSLQLAAGTYVIEVYAFETIRSSPAPVTTPRCMDISIQEM